MRRYRIWTLFSVLLALVLLPGYNIGSAAPPPTTPDAEFAPGELLIEFEPGISAQSATQALSQYDAARVRALYKSEVELWRVPAGEEVALAERLSALPNVAYAEPNYIVHALDTVPNDPSYSNQWAHSIMNSEQGWDVTTGTSAVTIAVLDSGIDETHPDLSSKIVAGYDFIDSDANPQDLNGHGTHVAGIAAAATDNSTGIAGTSWGANIMPIRVLNNEGSGPTSAMIDGINWAVSNGADVINLSLGGPDYSTTAQNTVNSAHASGVLVIAAMGNDRANNPTSYPAAYNNVMAVAATGPDDTWASYSQYGSHCDIAAPGGDMQFYHDTDGIYSTMPTYAVYLTTQYSYYQNYDYLNGTSQATPHVAGLAALVLSVDSTLTPDEVQTLIEQNAVDLGSSGWDADYGHGRIDINATLQALDTLEAPTLDAISNPDQDGLYTVNWNAVAEATSYTVQEDDNADFTSPQTVYSGSNTQHNVSGQSAGVWYYRVRASNASDDSTWSNIESTSVLPAAPMLNAISNSGSEDAYTVSWAAVTNATGYTLQEAPTDSFLPAQTITRYVGSNIQYNVTGQRDGTWHYRVRATAVTGDGDWSNNESTIVAVSPLSAPPLYAINNGDNNGDYLVDWQSVSGATSYTLEESADRYFTSPTEIYNGPATQFNITDQDGGVWHYRVRAHNATDSSPWSITRIAKVVYYVNLPLIMRNYGASSSVQNGGFEDGATNWTEYSSNGFDLIINSGFPGSVTPRSGQWAVWLGGANDETSYIEQSVTVSSQTPYLTYWHWIASEDTCSFDYGYVIVNGTIVEQYTLCDTESTGGWEQHSTNLSTYAGQTVTLRIQSVNDGSLNSNLLIDDVAFSSSALAAQRSGGQIDAEGAAQPKP